MKVSIQRSTGLQTYEVPPFAETMTVMAILDYIYPVSYTHLDVYKRQQWKQSSHPPLCPAWMLQAR